MALSPTTSRGAPAVVTREQLIGSTGAIANNATAALSWGSPFGTALLSLTVPTAPTVVTAGVYAVTARVLAAASMTAAGFFTASLEMDVNDEDASLIVNSPAAGAGLVSPSISLTLVYYVPAAGLITCRVTNHDGVQAIDFSLSATVQRLS